jgi:adenine/guanine phosphoribosyltransferase-like PRPP-binding protein
MRVEPERAGGLLAPQRIVLVDDFITKGTTLYAAASVLADAVPGSEVRCFALVRTKGLVPDVDAIVEPMEGELRYWPLADEVERIP